MFIEKVGKNGRVYKYKDLTGERFGTFTVLRRGKDIPTKSRTSITWVCRCDCGTEKEYGISNLARGKKKLENGEIKILSCGCKSSLPFGVSASKGAYRNYANNAELRGYEFNISLDEFWKISKCNCHYCGAFPKNKIGRTEKKRGNGHYIYNGMDRVDNKKGYFIDNVVPCCRRCNRAKDVMGMEEFLGWVESIYNHRILIKKIQFIPHSFGVKSA